MSAMSREAEWALALLLITIKTLRELGSYTEANAIVDDEDGQWTRTPVTIDLRLRDRPVIR
jgi:hypothetical protein